MQAHSDQLLSDVSRPAKPSSVTGVNAWRPFATRLLHTIGRFRRVRSGLAELKRLDDRMLDDIGLTRGEIICAARGRLHLPLR